MRKHVLYYFNPFLTALSLATLLSPSSQAMPVSHEPIFLPDGKVKIAIERPLEHAVDVLIVNYGTGQEHKKIHAALKNWAEQLSQSAIDFQVGLVEAIKDPSLLTTPPVLYPHVPRWRNVLESRLRRHIPGNPLMQRNPMQVILQSLQAPVHADFHRPSAALYVLLIFPEHWPSEDFTEATFGNSSDVQLEDFSQQLSSIKAPQYPVQIDALILSDHCPKKISQQPSAVHKLVQSFNGLVFDECRGLAATESSSALGQQIFSHLQALVRPRDQSPILLPFVPAPGSILVKYGRQIILPHARKPEAGWTYDGLTHTITLGAQIPWQRQPAGSQIEIIMRPLTWSTELY